MSHYIFYKIVSEDCPDYIYIGSTKSFRSRKYQHKNSCININQKGYNLKLYQKIRENGGWDNWKMIIIEEGNDLTFTQARIKEEELRLKYNGNLNMLKAYITEEEKKQQKINGMKEYYVNNKEKIKEKHKEYYENNKNQFLEYQKEYRENNREKVKECKKEYRKKNKEILKEKRREYYENNKEKAREYYLKKKEETLNKV